MTVDEPAQSKRSLPSEIDRRDFLVRMLTMAGLSVSASELWGIAHAATPSAQREVLDEICELVIPATDTPGARAAGVAAFLESAVAQGIRDVSPSLLSSFLTALDKHAKEPFLSMPPSERVAVLTEIDTLTMTAHPTRSALPADLLHWPTLKALILVGYYTSEVGSTIEQRYLLIPGRFDPDVPLAPGDRAWSSDWTGVKYG